MRAASRKGAVMSHGGVRTSGLRSAEHEQEQLLRNPEGEQVNHSRNARAGLDRMSSAVLSIAVAAMTATLVAMGAVGVDDADAAPKTVSGFWPSAASPSSLTGSFSQPRGVAVSVSGAGAADPGDVYVVDNTNNRVQVFSAAGAFKFMLGRDVLKPGAAGNVASNDRQTVTVNGGPTAGSFTLALNAMSTTPIAFNAPAADPGTAAVDSVEEALEGLSNVGAGNVAVSGPAGGPWTVEFVGAMADSEVPQLTASGSGLSPSGSIAVATLTDGANAAERCSVATDCKAGVTGVLGGMFRSAQGIAIDESDGSVYVSEQTNLRVQKFTADGQFVRAWGKDVDAVNPSVTGEVCTVGANCKAGVTGGTTLARGGEFTSTFSGHLAVAPVGAPNAGNVVVADPGNRRVQEFTPVGGFVRAWGFDVVQPGVVTTFEVCTVAADCKTAAAGGSGIGQFAASEPTRVAVDSTGAIYTVEQTGNFRVQKFDAALTTPSVFAPAVLSGTATTNGPSEIAIGAGDNVLVAKQHLVGTGTPPAAAPERRVLELDSGGTLLDTHAVGAGLGNLEGGTFVNNVNGLAANQVTGTVYVSTNSYRTPDLLPTAQPITAHRVYMLEAVSPPSGSLGVSAVSEHTALLSGSVNPNGPVNPLGVIDTSYRLEISEDGVAWTVLAPDVNVGHGTTGTGLSVMARDLKAGTLYQSRLVLSRQFSLPVTVPGPSFATAVSRPDVEALSPTDRLATSATLVGRINANGSATSYRFEYGPTIAYGTSVPLADASAGSASTPAVFAQGISGLVPDTDYHFRVVATNANGTAVSDDRMFRTQKGDQPDQRGIELVSQPDKIGGVGVGLWSDGVGQLASSGVPAYTGNRFLVGGSYGAPLNGDSGHGFTNDWSLAQRGDSGQGWMSRTPITHPNYQPRMAQFVTLTGVAEDLSRLFMTGGNATPAIFPEMGDDNQWSFFNAGFFLDWGSPEQASRWELLGPAGLEQVSDAALSGDLWNTAIAADGSTLVAQTTFDGATPPRAALSGLAGEGDPTWPAFGDLVTGRSIYLADISGPPADTFTGTSPRELVNVCSGTGSERTMLPAVAAGVLNAEACLPPEPGRDERLISDHGAALSPPTSAPALNGTVSEDGSRVFFMSPDPRASGVPTACSGDGAATSCPPQLYVRQKNSDGSVTTRWISKAVPALFGAQAASLTGAVRFEGATPDGSRVFFRTTSPLTVDDPNGLASPPSGGVKTGTPHPASSDLYMYELPSDPAADIGEGTLTRISAGPGGDGDCNSPLPALGEGSALDEAAAGLRFASDDGRRVYFVCSAPLPDVAGVAGGSITSPGGTPGTADQTNLYVYDEHKPLDQRWRFVTRLPRSSSSAGGNPLDSCASAGARRRSPLVAESGGAGTNLQVGSGGSGNNCFDGTADGSFVTFFTMARLTGDDPVGPATGDIYAYDADSDELELITGVQGGVGGTYLCAPGKAGTPVATDTALCHGDGGADQQSAVSTGGGGVVNSNLGGPTDPSDGSRTVFFESASQLVTEDLDSGYDVYQWRDGVLSLITSGAADSKDALYKGNTRDGRNLFFVTMDRLTWQDYDAVADIYVARVDGGIEEPAEPPVCDVLVGACQSGGGGSVAVAPVTSAPSSDGDADSGSRRSLSIAAIGAGARARAVRTGVLAVHVRAGGPGAVDAVGRARLGGKLVKVAGARKQATKAGVVRLQLRLSGRARRALRAGRVLRVHLQVRQVGARTRTATVQLKRGNRS